MGWLFTNHTDYIAIHKNALRVVCSILFIIAMVLSVMLLDASAQNAALKEEIEEQAIVFVDLDEIERPTRIAITKQSAYHKDAVLDKTSSYLSNHDTVVYRTALYSEHIIYFILVDDAAEVLKEDKAKYDIAAGYIYTVWKGAGYTMDVILDISDTTEPEITLYQTVNGIPSFTNF